MHVTRLQRQVAAPANSKLLGKVASFEELIRELEHRDLPESILLAINAQVEAVNRRATGDQALRKDLRKAQANIFKLLEKELKVVPKNFYRNRWMALGMAVIGIPLGVAFGASLGSMAFLGVGIPIGMSIGMALGAGMDKKAAEEGGS